MKKIRFVIFVALVLPLISGCVVVHKTETKPEKEVIVVPAEKHGKKKKDKVAVCYKGKTKMVKKKDVKKFIKKGAELGRCP